MDKQSEKQQLLKVTSQIKRFGADAALPHQLALPTLNWLAKWVLTSQRSAAKGRDFHLGPVEAVVAAAISEHKGIKLQKVLKNADLLLPLGLYAQGLIDELHSRVIGLSAYQFSVEELFIAPFDAGYIRMDEVLGAEASDRIRSAWERLLA
ncbi:hypothetical protein E4K72_01010 [Oxalobacteraceae bacterium OM1]|nr:hypothetical protein E4K72_01010 [Oxalobacteraceae bacterium OM1]